MENGHHRAGEANPSSSHDVVGLKGKASCRPSINAVRRVAQEATADEPLPLPFSFPYAAGHEAAHTSFHNAAAVGMSIRAVRRAGGVGVTLRPTEDVHEDGVVFDHDDRDDEEDGGAVAGEVVVGRMDVGSSPLSSFSHTTPLFTTSSTAMGEEDVFFLGGGGGVRRPRLLSSSFSSVLDCSVWARHAVNEAMTYDTI